MHRYRSLSVLALATLGMLSGCSGCASYRRCSLPEPGVLGALPERLSQTGLFDPANPAAIASGVIAYEPAFALWSDGADKRRWVALPEGARIDSSDADAWLFPAGTKFWKEFSRDGRRIETRLLFKHGPREHDWAGAAYVWNDDQNEAYLAPAGLRDAGGSGHDVPSAADCGGCHGGRRSHVLGFSAVQLAPAELPLSLEALGREGRLTHVPERAPSLPGSELDRAALGYLHANCGHCHNRERPARGDGPRCYDPERSIDFWLPSDTNDAEVTGMPAYTSTVPRFITPGEPDDSRLITLVSRRGWRLHMPPLGTHQIDGEGVRLLREWIASLAPERAPARAATPFSGTRSSATRSSATP
ncbi:MAG TPA: hypothetical protein VMG12_12740 [Polyangiaceae bacterium]|nr:hypothetical protein [Polyangiaceae bacterium]